MLIYLHSSQSSKNKAEPQNILVKKFYGNDTIAKNFSWCKKTKANKCFIYMNQLQKDNSEEYDGRILA